MRIGILTDFPTPTTWSGPALQSELLRTGLAARGHDVVMLGPDTRSRRPAEPGREVFLFRAVPHPTHPQILIALPAGEGRMRHPPRLDVILAQTTNPMVEYATWIRRTWRVPLLNTHTVHLPTHSHYLLPDALARRPACRGVMARLAGLAERSFARLYDGGDTLIVQSRHLVAYWRARGVTVPIAVLERPIDEARFGRPAGRDPFPPTAPRGGRLLVVCRHEREKDLDRLIRIFERHLAARAPAATLTLVGDGAAHAALRAQAARSRAAARIHFAGAVPFDRLVDWYRHADVFVYTSVSETFGNVVNEALYCGLPVVAFDDHMGVAHQVADGHNGRLVDPHPRSADADWARACLELLADPARRRALGERAASQAASRSATVMERLEALMEDARVRCHETVGRPLSQQPHVQQERALRSALRRWRLWNGLFVSASYAIHLDRLPGIVAGAARR